MDYFAQIDLPAELSENVCLEIEKSVKLCHSQKYIDDVKQKCAKLESGQNVIERQNDIYFSQNSYKGALLSVQAAVTAVENILCTDNQF